MRSVSPSGGSQGGHWSLNEVHGEEERGSGLRLRKSQPRRQEEKAERPTSHLLAGDFG